jgi:hypothetical protein
MLDLVWLGPQRYCNAATRGRMLTLVSFHERRYTIRSLRPQTMSVALRQLSSVTGRSLKVRRLFGGSLGASIGITSKLAAEQRPALEQLLFFNVNQHRVRVGIQQSIDTYGVPEIYEQDGGLRVRVGDIDGVQTLFAISEEGRPVGVAVFVRSAHERFAVLHLGVDPRFSLTSDQSTRVLLKLMHEIRSTARRTRGVDCIELVYKVRHAVRLHG